MRTKQFLHQRVDNIIDVKLNAFAKIYVRLYVIYHTQACLAPVARQPLLSLVFVGPKTYKK